ncbi:tRNA-specific adenosine deaminase 1 [Wallemia ichthyophaga EXF-994]|uniref:tRNA-specific adenosine deaminase 1 n=1 Tax=Wallemia ichthyophaga (strain EXF-994 / CBS 113033) TaxID=1299270 RepID=R9AGD7_WALI9|nr:tRNA-specific adenosine deaminase 1 [Wallemia ichthyophaga EXF-994]EOQ99130.1 tRNA-specific adenosine deaminase 1 [Wallemia ichthyophaga EXF-994]
MTRATPDDIARSVNDVYKSFPARLRPDIRPNGALEWTILAGFVLQSVEDEHLNCVSAGVGMKCLPASRIPLHGDMLHDTHAEILAKRGLAKWILNELSSIEAGNSSAYLDYSEHNEQKTHTTRTPKHSFKAGVQVYLYISALPCGDASMAHTADSQDAQEAAYYSAIPALRGFDGVAGAAGAASAASEATATSVTRGRMDYTKRGSIRTKPGRADAGSTNSLSCSDKLATYTLLGVQGGLLANIMQPVYIHNIVIGGVSSVDGEGRQKYLSECHRSLYLRVEESVRESAKESAQASPSRLDTPTDHLHLHLHLHRPVIAFTEVRFCHAKEEVEARARASSSQDANEHPHPPVLPAMHCANYVAGDSPLQTELVIGGLKNGNFRRRGGGPYWWKYRSRLCRLDLMRHYLSLECVKGVKSVKKGERERESDVKSGKEDDADDNTNPTYFQLKHSEASNTYRRLKHLLRTPPSLFSEWIVTHPKHAHFDSEGRINSDGNRQQRKVK